MSRHVDLISSLGELYTPYTQLAVLDPSSLTIPEEPLVAQFPRDAALEAGHTPEALDLLVRLPYLDVRDLDAESEIRPSILAVDYYNGREEAPDFEALRWMDDDPESEDNMIPGHSIKLTEQNVFGVSLTCNTETGEITI